jgi:hypothetical protein
VSHAQVIVTAVGRVGDEDQSLPFIIRQRTEASKASQVQKRKDFARDFEYVDYLSKELLGPRGPGTAVVLRQDVAIEDGGALKTGTIGIFVRCQTACHA